MRLRFLFLLGALLGLTLGQAAPSAALTLGFDCVTDNLAGDCAIGEAQVQVDVADLGGGQIGFTFRNLGPDASSITDIYWDDEALLAIFSITNTPGLVEFSNPASPGNFPGASNASPPFETTAGLSVDSDSPVQPLGVNPGEQLSVIFTMIGGLTFADAIQDLADGSLRIGVHVQGYQTEGSESFVNHPVPEPGTFAPVAGGLMALSAARRWRG